MANKLCAVCAKYNECTWMQVKALNSPTTDLGSFIRHDDWMGRVANTSFMMKIKEIIHEII